MRDLRQGGGEAPRLFPLFLHLFFAYFHVLGKALSPRIFPLFVALIFHFCPNLYQKSPGLVFFPEISQFLPPPEKVVRDVFCFVTSGNIAK